MIRAWAEMSDIAAIDFLTVPTATFRVLFVLVILSHDRRKILHTNVTEHPTASWTARQVLEAIGLDNVPTYLLRDRDAIYGRVFSRTMASVGLTELVTAPRSPGQNSYVERVIGPIRRECLNHTIIVGERHLWRVVRNYVQYYNDARTHLSLDKDAPTHRQVYPPEVGPVGSKPHCGGLHREYLREAA
jgi:putative transposase